MTVREEFGDKIIDRMPDWTVAEEAFLADIKEQLEAHGLKFVKYLPNMFTFRCVVGNAENTKWINVVGEDTRKDAAWMDHVSLRRMSSERDWKGDAFHYCVWERIGEACVEYMAPEYDDEIL